MTKRMLIDDTRPEETRVVIVNGNKVEDVEFESASRKQIKGNIYLAKVMRVEPRCRPLSSITAETSTVFWLSVKFTRTITMFRKKSWPQLTKK